MLQDTGSASTTLDEAGCPCAMFGPVRVQPETRCFGEFSLYTHMILLYSYYFWVVRYFVHFCSLELSAFAHIQSFELQSYVYIYTHYNTIYTDTYHMTYILYNWHFYDALYQLNGRCSSSAHVITGTLQKWWCWSLLWGPSAPSSMRERERRSRRRDTNSRGISRYKQIYDPQSAHSVGCVFCTNMRQEDLSSR